MPTITVKVGAHTRTVKGKTVKVPAFTMKRNVKHVSKKKRKPATDQQKKSRKQWYQKNKQKILQKEKQKRKLGH